MTTETVEQPRQEGGDYEESLKDDIEQTTHTHLDDGNSATDSDADDSAPELDDQDAALQQAHSEACCINCWLCISFSRWTCKARLVNLCAFDQMRNTFGQWHLMKQRCLFLQRAKIRILN